MYAFLFFAGLTGWAIVRSRNELGKLEIFGFCVGIAGLTSSVL